MSPGELLPLALYLIQQLGIMLGVGAASVTLVSYLVSLHDGVVDVKEAQFARVIQHILEVGLACIVLSGAAITAIHSFAGDYAVLSSPAYVFKWLLIGFVSFALVLRRAKPYVSPVWGGLVGATWYALFILHIVAPITFWEDLLFLYAAWVAGFMILWAVMVKVFTVRTAVPAAVKAPAPVVKSVPAPALKPVAAVVKAVPVAAAPKVQQPAPPPPPVPKPAPPPPMPPVAPAPLAPAVTHAELPPPPKVSVAPPPPAPVAAAVPVKPPPPPAAPAPQKPQELVVAENIPMPPMPKTDGLLKNIDESYEIPHVYVMPRTPEDVEKHMRSASLAGFANV